MIWYIKTYTIAYVKIQKSEDILSIMLNCCLKVDFQKVDQHVESGSMWLMASSSNRNKKDVPLESSCGVRKRCEPDEGTKWDPIRTRLRTSTFTLGGIDGQSHTGWICGHAAVLGRTIWMNGEIQLDAPSQ